MWVFYYDVSGLTHSQVVTNTIGYDSFLLASTMSAGALLTAIIFLTLKGN